MKLLVPGSVRFFHCLSLSCSVVLQGISVLLDGPSGGIEHVKEKINRSETIE